MTASPVLPQVVAVVGPTATGKSDLGVELALRLDGEVVNADASQLYRGMDIGTAKLTRDEQRGVPHHLLDLLDIRQESTLGVYQSACAAAVSGILARGRTPIVVGGSGLYVRAAIDHLDIPPTDAGVRAAWEQRLDQQGSAALHDLLRDRDPAAAAAILPSNGRRVVRALEVIELTGRPFSATRPQRRTLHPTVQIGLRGDREHLDERVAGRVHRMMEAGFLEEVRTLAGAGLRGSPTASRAIGYAQLLRHLDDEITLDEAVDDTVNATRRLIRRQETWFRPDPRIQWMDADASDLVGRALVSATSPIRTMES